MNFVETFRQLLAAASPSGYEGPEAQVIRQLAQPYCDEIRTDALGNVICHKKGGGRKMMFAAHMGGGSAFPAACAACCSNGPTPSWLKKQRPRAK